PVGALRGNHYGRSLFHATKQVDYIFITHSDAAVAVRPPYPILMLCAVDVDETFLGGCVFGLEAFEPKNARRNQILGLRQRFFRPQRNATSKYCSMRHAVPDFFRDFKTTQRRFHAPLFRARPKSGTGNWI